MKNVGPLPGQGNDRGFLGVIFLKVTMEKKMKKTFYCVMVEKYDDGRVLACARATELKALPKNHARQIPGSTACITWYEDVAKAQAALTEAQALGGKQGATAEESRRNTPRWNS
jgi:hypothetical protein